MLRRSLSLITLLPVSLAAQDDGQSVPVIEAQQVYAAQEKFDRPLLVEFHESDPGYAYVVVQPGQIFRVAREGDSGARDVFLDLDGKAYVGDNWEEGLLGFAFDPDYANNGQVFVCYSEKTDMRTGEMGKGKKAKSTRQSVISRFDTKVGEDGVRVVDLGSELRVMTIFQPFGNHNGGTIVFGPDGMLYIAVGDGGAQRDPFKNSQDKSSLLGKVLRIDVRNATGDKPYAIPADNPFVGEEGARGEVWCYGLRNPWRIAFDRKTGDLWCGDVGQFRIEEVDRLVKGGNYGWNYMEGTEVFRKRAKTRPKDMIPPVAEYGRKDGVSVTGGFVYRGKAIPELDGCYIYGDFSTFRIWAVHEDRENGNHEVIEICRAPGQLSSFAQEPDGELLVTCFNGKVYRLVPVVEDGD